MKNFSQNLIALVSFFVILTFLLYGMLWFVVAGRMNHAIDDVWAHQQNYQITIEGDKPHATGFPAPPKIVFAGKLTDQNGLVFSTPQLAYQGFPLPTQSMTLSAPQGLDVSGSFLKSAVHLDNFLIRIHLPANFPHHYDEDALQNWQRQGGTIPVENLIVKRGSLVINGDGYLGLDQKLQPSGTLSVSLTGVDAVLNELLAAHKIKPNEALMAQSIINLMAQKDSVTGLMTLKAPISIQQGGVFLGPLRVASIPEWQWKSYK